MILNKYDIHYSGGTWTMPWHLALAPLWRLQAVLSWTLRWLPVGLPQKHPQSGMLEWLNYPHTYTVIIYIYIIYTYSDHFILYLRRWIHWRWLYIVISLKHTKQWSLCVGLELTTQAPNWHSWLSAGAWVLWLLWAELASKLGFSHDIQGLLF